MHLVGGFASGAGVWTAVSTGTNCGRLFVIDKDSFVLQMRVLFYSTRYLNLPKK